MIHLLIGTLMAAGGTLALNEYWERAIDARMDRTRRRPPSLLATILGPAVEPCSFLSEF